MSKINEKIEEIGLCISENLPEKRSTKMKGMIEEIRDDGQESISM